MKIINPMHAEIIADTNTAPAAISWLSLLIYSVVETKSTTFSMAVCTFQR